MIYQVRESGNNLYQPDAAFGYGIPSFEKAFWKIKAFTARGNPSMMEIYPNPARYRIYVRLPGAEPGTFTLNTYDARGRMVSSQPVALPGEVSIPGHLATGLYILEISTPQHVYRNRLIIE